MQHTRRDFLKRLSLAVGATTAAALVTEQNMAQAMYFHQLEGSGKRKHDLFNDSQKAVLFEVCDTILPPTDTPSATEADCHNFVEHQLVHCHSEQDQTNCKAALDFIESHARKAMSNSYTALTAEQKADLLNSVEKLNGFNEEQKQQFKTLKVLIIFGYFTSEIGATQALNYQFVPGGYKGSIPYDENSKAWGSKSYY